MWNPPANPDPSTILDSARDDAWQGLHEQALEKLVWFHKNAKQIEPALSAVRLSFALSYWKKLAADYPPALDALIATRDETEVCFRDVFDAAVPQTATKQRMKSCSELFQEVAALNRYLGHQECTADLFRGVAQKDAEIAQMIYKMAEPSLIAGGFYEACNAFLEPSQRVDFAEMTYRDMTFMESNREIHERDIPQVADLFFIKDIATLVGLLVLNNRIDEASSIQSEALKVLDSVEFRLQLNDAFAGRLPKQI
jgi:hypothetical protein